MGNCQTHCYQKSASQVNSVDCTKLIIHVKTWQKEAFSLFDYENAANVQEQTFQINSEGYLVGRNQVEWTENESIIKDQLCKIKKKNENYYLVNSFVMNEDQKSVIQENEECHTIGNKTVSGKIGNKIWKVIHENGIPLKEGDVYFWHKSSIRNNWQRCFNIILQKSRQNNKNFQLSQNQQKILRMQKLQYRKILLLLLNYIKFLFQISIIKLGRVKFTIRSIVLDVQHVQSILEFESQQSNVSDQQMCRICCSSQQTAKNPLLNPCKCSGSIKYIHLECLKTWLRMKLENRQSENCTVYLWKNLECELCKFNFPPKFKSDDAYYDLIELSKPNDYPYLMMEFTNKQGQQIEWNNSSGVYIVKFSNSRDLRLGRSNDTDVRVNDISVSRNHARLFVSDNQVYLFDNHSKFGTLQQIREEKLQIQRGLEVQIGRSLISFQ